MAKREVKTEKLSEKQVNQVLNAFDFLQFSKGYNSAYYDGYFTPDIVNRQMQNINMNPRGVELSELEKALQNPKDSEEVLRNYATYAENNNMYYKRLARYFPDMAAFHLTYDCMNAYEKKDFISKEYKEDVRKLDEFCSKFDCKEEFQKVFRQLIRQGVFYCILRKDKNKYTLQELPAQFCKITGRSAYGLLFDFNMDWFISNYGVDIKMYPPVFRKMFRDVMNTNKAKQPYNPAKNIDNRNSTFVYWHQCSPEDGFWCFKLNPEVATITPYFSPLFPNISYTPVVRGLQYDKYFIQASKLLVGILGFNKDAKSGQVPNQLNMTPDVLGKFLGVARKGLAQQIGLVALPVDDIKIADFDVDDTNIESESNETMAQSSVASYQALQSSEKLNSHQSKLASAIDMNVVNATYDIFSDFVEYYVNAETKKYKFTVSFKDFYVPDDQQRVASLAKDFMALGFTDIQLIARALDMNPFELQRHMRMTSAMGIQKDMVIPISAYNNGGNNSVLTASTKVGRPRKENSDNDNTDASWQRGSNDLK